MTGGASPTLGWQWRARKKGGPVFGLITRTLSGSYKRAPEADMLVGHQYDIRFREERLAIHEHRRPELILELPYAAIEAVDIGGPGLVPSGGMLTGRRFAAIVALEGLAAAVLSSQDLRIYLSRPLAEIRAAREAVAVPPPGPAAAPPPGATSGAAQVENLARLAAMLEAGLLTRAEFDTLKASLLRAS